MLSLRLAGDKACELDLEAGEKGIPMMQRVIVATATILTGYFGGAAVLRGAGPRVELEIVTDQPFVGNETRAWTELLNQAGFSSVRIKSGAGEPTLQTLGPERAPVYRVVGVLTTGNQLL